MICDSSTVSDGFPLFCPLGTATWSAKGVSKLRTTGVEGQTWPTSGDLWVIQLATTKGMWTLKTEKQKQGHQQSLNKNGYIQSPNIPNTILGHSSWHLCWHFLTFHLAFYFTSLLIFYLTFYATSCTRNWGPTVPTGIWLSQLRSGSAHCALAHAVEVRQAAPLIKSRDPHLPVGEKHHKGRNQQEPVFEQKKNSSPNMWSSSLRSHLSPLSNRIMTRVSLPLEPWPNVFLGVFQGLSWRFSLKHL